MRVSVFAPVGNEHVDRGVVNNLHLYHLQRFVLFLANAFSCLDGICRYVFYSSVIIFCPAVPIEMLVFVLKAVFLNGFLSQVLAMSQRQPR